ncbi:transposase [Aneurinibacillus aneurinilyticus]|uniref:Transposase n=1 Tax=Aneurinibacillus aneurinilyticus TaxID=1391 RepID=A0A848D2U8_ANEAE|nr:transposase [Aneurinibacillus aneurinilyticus]NMF01100.1 transposase [Aneurinibacillus aneurinilyticus]
MIQKQQSMLFSPFMAIYDLVVSKDHLLRKINEMIDFSFVYDELKDTYCLTNGRNAIDPIRMFKYLLLKSIYDLSDVDVVERSKYDMSFKYFLHMAPEESMIEASSLTKFRKLRLRDLNLLDMLINKTVEVAREKGIIKSTSIIVDATHTKARYHQKSPKEILMDRSKKLRKAVYTIDETMKDKFPAKTTTDVLEDEIDYCQKLIDVIEKEGSISEYPKVKEKLNLLKETVAGDIEQLRISEDQDARVGHKSADSSFFGYKTHLAMSEERIITAAIITTCEKIEAKNSELKHRHGYDVVSSSGLLGMNLQGAMAIFTVNLKRIVKLLDEK